MAYPVLSRNQTAGVLTGTPYGGNALGPTQTPGWADALQQLGIGLLANEGRLDKGVAQGMQGFLNQKLRAQMLQREDAQRQQEFDYRAGRDAVADKRDQRDFDWKDEEADTNRTFTKGLQDDSQGFTAGQNDLSRQHSAGMQDDAQGHALGVLQRTQNFEAGQSATAFDRQKELAALQGWNEEVYYDAQGNQGTRFVNPQLGRVQYMAPGTEEMVQGNPMAQAAPSAYRGMTGKGGASGMPASAITVDFKAYAKDSETYATDKNQYDDLTRMEQIAPDADIGPDVFSQATRFVTKAFGLEGIDQNTAMGRMTAQQELDKATAEMKGQGQITENEREILKKAIADPTGLSRDEFLKAVAITKKRLEGRMETMEAYDRLPEDQRAPGTWLMFRNNYQARQRRTAEGNPASGVPQGTTSTGVPWKVVQ